ncbi:MAG: hypothetical protein KJ607_11565, partial [Bacteroidetes bacterium]|nr:hypothetical protein [Bacteroidota bacterium]
MMTASKYEEAEDFLKAAIQELEKPNAIPNPSLKIQIEEQRAISAKCIEIQKKTDEKNVRTHEDSVNLRKNYLEILSLNGKDKVIRKKLYAMTASAGQDCNSLYEIAKIENQVPSWKSFLEACPDCEQANTARDILEKAYLE